MKRSLLLPDREVALVVAGTCLIAGTYGLVRLAFGLFLPGITASVPMSSAVVGYLSSGASAAYCVGALAGLVAGGHARLLVVGSVVTAAGGAVAMALAPTLLVLAPATVAASAGAGLASPGMVAVVARNVEAGSADRAQARVNSGTGPGLVAAGVLALMVPDWRAGFAVSAVLTAAAGLAVLLLDRRRTPSAAPVAGRECAADPSLVSALAWPAAGAILLGAASAVVWTYGRAHLVEAGASATGSVLAWIALGVGGAATALTASLLTRWPAPRAWLVTCLLVASSTAGLAPRAATPVAVLACAGFGWSFVAATSALIAWTHERVPGRAAAGTSGLFIALVVGQAAGSSAAGRVAEVAGLATAFWLAGGVAVLAAACGWRGASRTASDDFPSPEPSHR